MVNANNQYDMEKYFISVTFCNVEQQINYVNKSTMNCKTQLHKSANLPKNQGVVKT